MVYNAARRLRTLLYPPYCLLCGAPGQAEIDLCPACLADLPRLGTHCRCCAAALPFSDTLCGHCRRNPPAYDRILAPFVYSNPLDWLIPRLKFSARLPHARLLGELLLAHCAQQQALPQCLIPVPLHRARLRQRGFNQALEIARPLARGLNIPINKHSVVRIHSTSPQMALPAKKRQSNIRGAFELRKPLGLRHVALIDDVVTTAATVNELARVLKKAGVERVDVWACARAI